MTKVRVDFFAKIALFIIRAKLEGIDLLPFSFIRTSEQQNKFYKAGKSRCDGHRKKSKHQLGRAIDFVIIKNNTAIWNHITAYDFLGEIWRNLGGKWEGDWKDTKIDDIYHFEY